MQEAAAHQTPALFQVRLGCVFERPHRPGMDAL